MYLQGNQLRRDLNLIVGTGRNWKIPSFWPFLLRYVSGPVLAIIFSFAFPEFHTLKNDPLMVLGFTVAWIGLVLIILGFALPRYYDVLIPPHRRDEGKEQTVAMELKGEVVARAINDGNLPDADRSSSEEKGLEGKEAQPQMQRL